MTKVTTAAQLLDSYLGDISLDQAYKTHSIPYRVGCVKMSAPRHERWEYLSHFGLNAVEEIFQSQPLRPGSLSFVFPERWMSVHEQRAFVSAIEDNETIEKITHVDILTSSPLIIGEFHREQIRILTFPDDHLHNGTTKAMRLREELG